MNRMEKLIGIIRKYEMEIGRLGLGFVLIYAGVASFLVPENWIGFVPQWIEIAASRDAFLMVHGALDRSRSRAHFQCRRVLGRAFRCGEHGRNSRRHRR